MPDRPCRCPTPEMEKIERDRRPLPVTPALLTRAPRAILANPARRARCRWKQERENRAKRQKRPKRARQQSVPEWHERTTLSLACAGSLHLSFRSRRCCADAQGTMERGIPAYAGMTFLAFVPALFHARLAGFGWPVLETVFRRGHQVRGAARLHVVVEALVLGQSLPSRMRGGGWLL